MKKLAPLSIGVIIITLVFITYRFESIQDRYKAHLGKEININGDTLIIINYSMSEQCFILSNRTRISKELVK